MYCTYVSISGSLPPWSIDEKVDWEGNDIVDENYYHDQGHK